ncbi:MAG: hypothetical protein F6K10_38915 [Moorea sp. SIO2B7]|nr:hypothetical protein [Moorena sp. SIO2B7]
MFLKFNQNWLEKIFWVQRVTKILEVQNLKIGHLYQNNLLATYAKFQSIWGKLLLCSFLTAEASDTYKLTGLSLEL